MNESDADSFILIIKDEPYEVILKEEQGLVNHTIDSNMEIKDRWYTVNGKKIPEINILWHVNGITSEIASSLDTKEQIQLLKDYLRSQKTIRSIKNHQDSYIKQTKGDYDIAVNNIFSEQPDYVTSFQASVRFACRILKAKLKGEDKAFEDDETLSELAIKLDDIDFKEIEEIIPWVQKSPEEGDANVSTTLEDAVNAVLSSVALYVKLFADKKDEKKSRAFLNISS